MYKCTQCSEPLKNSLHSNKHWRKHHPSEYQDIPEDQRLSSKCHVTVQPSIPNIPWWCPQCSNEFPTEGLRDLHISSSHPSISTHKPPHQCQFCQKRYPCPKELQLHQTIRHSFSETNNQSISSKKARKFFHKCPLCPEVFSGGTGKVDLLTHQSRVHKISQFKCPTCQKEFLSASALKAHLTTHQFDLKCPHCGKMYYSKQTFDRHVAVQHEKSTAFTCDLCGKNLADKNTLLHHQRDMHGTSEKRWRCEVDGCGKRLKDLYSFKIHMSRHAKKPEYKCSKCGKGNFTKK